MTDEIYEHIVHAGHHHPIATWPGMRGRTVTISGLSKTFSCTGWRLGYAIAPPEATNAIRKVHDFLTVGAPAPLQAAGAVAMAFDADYYNHLAGDYRARRDLMCGALVEAGFTLTPPEGAYYVLAGYDAHSRDDDRTFAHWLAREGAWRRCRCRASCPRGSGRRWCASRSARSWRRSRRRRRGWRGWRWRGGVRPRAGRSAESRPRGTRTSGREKRARRSYAA